MIILPSPSIDCDQHVSSFFLPYQLRWILDDSPLCLAEKSVRIGWTFADAFKNVRKRLYHPRRDYLFSSKDQSTAIEYVTTCYQFCQLYNRTRSVISHGIQDLKVPIFKDGKTPASPKTSKSATSNSTTVPESSRSVPTLTPCAPMAATSASTNSPSIPMPKPSGPPHQAASPGISISASGPPTMEPIPSSTPSAAKPPPGGQTTPGGRASPRAQIPRWGESPREPILPPPTIRNLRRTPVRA